MASEEGIMSNVVAKTRKHWAGKICARHKRFVDDFFGMGRDLLAAKKALPHGDFLNMIEHDLPFGKRTAQMLMRIAGDSRLRKANLGSLPWRTLAELQRLDDETFNQGVASGEINKSMKREDVKKIGYKVKKFVKEIPVHYTVMKPSEQSIVEHEEQKVARPPPKPEQAPSKTIRPVYVDGEAVKLLRRLDELLHDPNRNWPEIIEATGPLVEKVMIGLNSALDEHSRGKAMKAAADQAEKTTSTLQ
jgi:Protein of unknown function (DUF3102)